MAIALKYLYHCGYVHRDVSTGNVLCRNERGVLIDLEYAKHIDAETLPHGPITVSSCQI